MNQEETIKILVEALEAARNHLDYCGYGDSWEREYAEDLPDKIENALEAGYVFAPTEEFLEKQRQIEQEFKKVPTCQFCGKTLSIGGSLNSHWKHNKKCREIRGLEK